MEIFKKFTAFLGKQKKRTSRKSARKLCPVCWGYQEYDQKERILFEDKQIDANNHLYKYMRIQKLLKEHIEGRKLKKAKIKTCSSCVSI